MSDLPEDEDEDEIGLEPIPEEIPNAADAKSFKRQKRNKETLIERDRRFWHGVLSNEDGRRIIWAMLTVDMHLFTPQFACGPNGMPQPDATWFMAGQRENGLKFYRMLMTMDQEGVMLMQREHDSAFADQRPKRLTMKNQGN